MFLYTVLLLVMRINLHRKDYYSRTDVLVGGFRNEQIKNILTFIRQSRLRLYYALNLNLTTFRSFGTSREIWTFWVGLPRLSSMQHIYPELNIDEYN